VLRFTGLRKTLRTILGDIYVYKNLTMFFRSIGQYFASVNNPDKDPYMEVIYELVKISDRFNLKSEFYFMGAEPNRFDCGYEITTPCVLNVISLIQQRGMFVGYHGGYETSTDSERFAKGKKRIEAAIGNKIVSGRQHYLRFDIHSSFKVWDECDMQYDLTLGYADREGFRCGTCYEYHPYDFENDREYTVKERPLIVMDATLYDYRKYTIKEAYGQMVKLYLRCKAVGGNFVLLWHNGFVAREAKWLKDVYCCFIKEYNNGTNYI
jgi:hypothetical protein